MMIEKQGELIVEITIKQLQDYLLEHYKDGGIDQSLFMKLVEEIGEVADVLNQKAGRKARANAAAEKPLNILELSACAVLLLTVTAYLVDGSFNPFLYFRF